MFFTGNTTLLSILALLFGGSELNQVQTQVCTSQQCSVAVKAIKQSMNYWVDPCENFYKFSCGHDMGGRAEWNEYFQPANIQRAIKILISSPVSSSDAPSLARAKKFYAGCVDTDTLDTRGVAPLVSLIRQIEGWPMLQLNSLTCPQLEKYSVERLAFNLKRISGWIEEFEFFREGGFFRVAVTSANEEPSQRLIKVFPPSFPLKDLDHFKCTKLGYCEKQNGYIDYMVNVVNIITRGLNRNINQEELLGEAKAMAALEGELVKGYFDSLEDQDDFVYMTIAEFQNSYESGKTCNCSHSDVSWLSVLQDYIGAEAKLTSEERILVFYPNYFKNLGRALNKSPMATIVNYGQWMALRPFLTETTEELRKMVGKFEREVLHRNDYIDARHTTCSDLDSFYNRGRYYPLMFAVGFAYVNRFFRPEDQRKVSQILNYTTNAYYKQIQELDWMDTFTKQNILKRLKEIKPLIAYPDWLTEAEALDKFYDSFLTPGAGHFENHLAIMNFQTKMDFQKLRDPYNTNDFMPLVESYAGFVSSLNLLYITPSILIAPVYTAGAPGYLNFGAIGSIISNAISQAIYPMRRGLHEDYERVRSLWSEESYNQILVKTECLQSQYRDWVAIGNEDALEEDDLSNPSMKVSVEDNFGLKMAYSAYKNWLLETNQGREEGSIPGFDKYSADQLFFLSFAQLWCENDNLSTSIASLEHRKNAARLLGSTMNSNDFARVWNCSEESGMNPKNKCALW
ncbi:unnamed protein product [Allacma fusca]|uniref:Endothelin-converting enzyme 1 n=1 Tax=Allacma fusca TaxID=39272 RepID=A0A8J2JUI6_9HEXA|nr:unnamed protein product [Allacma fusca]